MAPSPPPVRAILWDLDGTLFDSRRSIRETMNRVLRERGHAGFSVEEVRGLIGLGLRSILRKREPDAAVVEAMAMRYRELYMESGWVTVRLHAGVEEILRNARAAGIRQGVVTSKGQAEAESVLRDLGLLHYMDGVVGDDDVRPIKPDPAPVVEACRRLDVDAGNAVMVGDTSFDVAAGRGAGCRTVGVLWGTDGRAELTAAGCDTLASDARQLRRALHL